MSLLLKVQALQLLEKQATPAPWIATEDRKGEFVIVSNPEHWIFTYPEDCPGIEVPDAKLISGLRNAAPDMLAVLAMLREGDAETTGLIMQEDVCGCDDPHCQRKTELLARLQAACELMEADPK